MVNFFAMVNSGKRPGRDEKSFHRLRAVTTKLGESALQFSWERQGKWLAATLVT